MNDKDYTETTQEHIEINDVIGEVSDCERLNVRSKPSMSSEVEFVIDKGTELLVDLNESTDEFYKICLATGVEGYCLREFVKID